MGLKFIKTIDPKTQKHQIDMPRGNFVGLKVVIEGTTDTGETLTLADLGRYRIEREGEGEIHGSDLQFISEYINLKFGVSEVTNPTAGATRIVFFIPFFHPDISIPNALSIASKEEVDLFFDFSADISTRFGSNAASVTIHGVEERDVPENYLLKITQQDIQASAAGRESEALNVRNLASVLLRDSGDKVDQIQLSVDGETIVDNVNDADLRDLSNLFSRVEAVQSLAEINLVESGNIIEASNQGSQLEARFTDSGTLDVRMLSVRFQSQGQARSQQAIAARAKRKISAAGITSAGNSRPAGAIANRNN